jgi:hypothetical protein
MAENAPNPRVQAFLRDMAHTWTRLALESERTLKQSRPPLQLIRFLQDTSLGPEEIAVLVAASEAALRELDLTGHADPGAATLPKAIIRFWRQGERDPQRLYERAIEPLSGLPPAASAG